MFLNTATDPLHILFAIGKLAHAHNQNVQKRLREIVINFDLLYGSCRMPNHV